VEYIFKAALTTNLAAILLFDAVCWVVKTPLFP
jgi:hypothetical protein